MDKKEEGSNYRVIIIDNYGKDAFTITESMKGVVIATGDVVLDLEGKNFTGLIIAGCQEMKEGVTVSSNGVIDVKSFSAAFKLEHSHFSIIFGNSVKFCPIISIEGAVNIFLSTFPFDPFAPIFVLF